MASSFLRLGVLISILRLLERKKKKKYIVEVVIYCIFHLCRIFFIKCQNSSQEKNA